MEELESDVKSPRKINNNVMLKKKRTKPGIDCVHLDQTLGSLNTR